MAENKGKFKDILVRDIPESLYLFIIDEQTKSLKEGNRKSLGTVIIELATKGMEQIQGQVTK